METVFIIIGVVIAGIWIYGTTSIKRKVNSYRNALQHGMNAMDSSSYKETTIYKDRISALEEQGFPITIQNFFTDMREAFRKEYNVIPEFFKRDDVLNIEYLFVMKYAIVHGYADEFQETMVIGKVVEDMMAGRK